MTRLPQPGKDAGQWGDILNDYLSQSHNADGTLKDNVVGASQLQDNAVTDATIAPGAITKATVGLANVDNTADNAKPVSTVQQAALDLKADTSTLATKLNTSDLDAQTAAKITTDGTATQVALSSTYVAFDSLGVVLAKKHGIVPDGTTDCTVALQALVTNLSAAGGGHIQLPAGTIKLSGSINCTSNITISGAGVGATIIKPTKTAFLYVTGTQASPVTDFHLRDLTIDAADQTGGYKGIAMQYLKRCSFQNLHVKNTQFTGVGIDYLVDCHLSNVITENTGLGNDGTMPGGNGIGIGVGGFTGIPEDFALVGCVAIAAKRSGIMIERSGIATTAGARIIGCYATGCEKGFQDAGGAAAIFEGNFAWNNTGPGFAIDQGTIGVSGPGYMGRVSGNSAWKNGAEGIRYDASLVAPQSLTYAITGNTCSQNAGAGIKAMLGATDVANVDISGNQCWRNTLPGLWVVSSGAGSCVDWRITGNDLPNNGRATYLNQMRIDANMIGGSVSENTCPDNDSGPATSGLAFLAGRTLTDVKITGNTARGLTAIVLSATIVGCVIKDNPGYNPQGPAAISVTASPFTYTAGPTPEVVYIDGGTVSGITRNGVTVGASTGRAVHLAPNQAVVVTYTVAPTMTKDRL